MKLSTGKVAFPLEFDNGDVENVFINPYDRGIQDRIRGFENSIKSRLEKIRLDKYKDAFGDKLDLSNFNFTKMLEMSSDELKEITEKVDIIAEIDRELEKQFCDEIDSIFDSDVSSKAFKYVPPLAIVPTEDGSGEIYLLLVLKALAFQIEKFGNKTNKIANKYTEKYPKK